MKNKLRIFSYGRGNYLPVDNVFWRFKDVVNDGEMSTFLSVEISSDVTGTYYVTDAQGNRVEKSRVIYENDLVQSKHGCVFRVDFDVMSGFKLRNNVSDREYDLRELGELEIVGSVHDRSGIIFEK